MSYPIMILTIDFIRKKKHSKVLNIENGTCSRMKKCHIITCATHVHCILYMYEYYISIKIMTGKEEP